MRNARCSVTDSPVQPPLLNRKTAKPSAGLFLLGRCAGLLLLLIVLTASMLGVVSTVLVFERTKDLVIGNSDLDSRQSVHFQSPGNESQDPHQK
jgi:hypothetical protein